MFASYPLCSRRVFTPLPPTHHPFLVSQYVCKLPFVPGEFLHPTHHPFSCVPICLQATPFVPGVSTPQPTTHHPTTLFSCPNMFASYPLYSRRVFTPLPPTHHPFLVSHYVCKLPPLFQESFYTQPTTPPPFFLCPNMFASYPLCSRGVSTPQPTTHHPTTLFSCPSMFASYPLCSRRVSKPYPPPHHPFFHVPLCLWATPFIPGEFLHPYPPPHYPFSLVPLCLQAITFVPGEFLHPTHHPTTFFSCPIMFASYPLCSRRVSTPQPTTPFLVSQYVCKLTPLFQESFYTPTTNPPPLFSCPNMFASYPLYSRRVFTPLPPTHHPFSRVPICLQATPFHSTFYYHYTYPLFS